MAENGNGNGNGLLKASAPLLTIVAIITGLAAIVAPMRQSIDGIQRQVDDNTKWQNDYMRGQIPSSAEKELAAVSIKFAEVETQFRALGARVDKNELIINDKINSSEKEMALRIELAKRERPIP